MSNRLDHIPQSYKRTEKKGENELHIVREGRGASGNSSLFH